MTLSIAEPTSPRHARPATQAGATSISPGMLVLIGTALSILLSWSNIVSVWRSGTFFDTDDAMRMVQLRAWLDGQGWFDLTVHRLDPSQGVFMHWSRVVDIPLAALVRGFELFTSQAQAELLARLVFPLALQAGLIAAVIFTARVLVGSTGALPAMLLAVTSCVQFGQFVPGRIDHHAPQITLLILMTGFAADAMLRDRRGSAAWAAVVMAVSVAISLENLPFIAVIVSALVLTWIVRGAASGAVLRSFGLTLAVVTTVLFIALISPSRYAVVTADAFSLPHWLAAVLGGVGCAALPAWRLSSVQHRIAAAACIAAATGGLVAALCPGVLASPYAQLDPVVRSVWLSRVTEALPLTTAVRLHPQAATLIVLPLLVGLAGVLLAAFRSDGVRRAAWLTVAGLALAGLAGALWEVRVIASATPLALLGGVWAFTAVAGSAETAKPSLVRALCAFFVLFPFAPMAWAIVPTPEESVATSRSTKDAEVCREAEHVTPLASLGPGLIFAPIDSGSHLLVHTPLSVLGAPYHRNNHGNRTVIDGFSAEGADAERIVKATGARYVALCPGQVQAEALTTRNPNGLAAQLLAGNIPSWLERRDVPGTPYLVFAVRDLRPTLP